MKWTMPSLPKKDEGVPSQVEKYFTGNNEGAPPDIEQFRQDAANKDVAFPVD